MRLRVLSVILALLAGSGALAQPLDGATARKQLFGLRGADVAFAQGVQLSDRERATLRAMTKERGINYYGAIAFSPADGFFSNSLQGGFNYHDTDNAARAALTACEAAKSGGRCVVAAYVVPRRWERRAIQLSYNATASFRAYRQGRGEKALAASAATGMYAIAKGANSAARAIAECNALARSKGATDCVVVVQD